MIIFVLKKNSFHWLVRLASGLEDDIGLIDNFSPSTKSGVSSSK